MSPIKMNIVVVIITGIFTIMGVIIGAYLSFAINRRNQYKTFVRKLLDRLMLLRHDLQGGTNFILSHIHGTTPETWDESFKDIWILYNSVVDWAPFYRKYKIRKAWNQYKGNITSEDLLFMAEPQNKEEFIHRILTIRKIHNPFHIGNYCYCELKN